MNTSSSESLMSWLHDEMQLDEHGIWTSSGTSAVAYPESGNEACYLLEDQSFWFSHRNDCIMAVMRLHLPSGLVLDLGGGNGYVTRRMREEGYDAVLMEPGPVGAWNGHVRRQIPTVIRGSSQDIDLPSDCFDAITLFDVVEHVERDGELLDSLAVLLRPRGLVFITVPAHAWLWSCSDDEALHCRRYTGRRIRMLMGSQYELVYCTYFFAPLVLPTLCLRVLPYRLLRKGTARGSLLSVEQEHGVKGGVMASFLSSLLQMETRWIAHGHSVPFGASILCVARKRDR